MSESGASIFDTGLPRTRANHRPLTPLDFLAWSAVGLPRPDWRRLWRPVADLGRGRPALPPAWPAPCAAWVSGAATRWRSCAPTSRRCWRRITASRWPGQCSTRSTPGSTRPRSPSSSSMARPRCCWPTPNGRRSSRRRWRRCSADPAVIDIVDPAAPGRAAGRSWTTRRCWPRAIRPSPGSRPADEWDAISLCYTSGTTGNPKGVVYHHRGAFLNAMGNALVFGLSSRSSYLWTLPMFHCNGWTYTWAVTAVGGTHVCLRKVDPAVIFPLIEQAGVTHLCGAPIVLNMLVHAPAEVKRTLRPHDRGRDRRRGPAQRGDRGHGADGLSRHPSLRPDRELRPGHRLRRAAGLAGAAAGRARRPDGAPGRALPDPGRGAWWPIPRAMAEVPADGSDAGRDHAARQHGDEGLPEEPDRHRRGVPRRLVPHRRPRRAAPRRLCRGQGPRQGHHHLRRREHLLARGRGGALPPPGGDGGGRGRHARREVRRAALRLRHAEAGCRGRRGRRSSPGAASGWPTSRRRAGSCSARCPRPRPARSRSSSCASARSRARRPNMGRQ